MRRRLRKIVFYAIFGAGVLAAVVGDGGWLDLRRVHADRSEAHERVEVIRARVDAETRAVDRLRRDSLARERIAREKIGMVRPGEVVFLLPVDDGAPRSRTVTRDGSGSVTAQ